MVEAIRRVCVENGRGDLNSHTIVPIRGERTQPNTKRSKKTYDFSCNKRQMCFWNCVGLLSLAKVIKCLTFFERWIVQFDTLGRLARMNRRIDSLIEERGILSIWWVKNGFFSIVWRMPFTTDSIKEQRSTNERSENGWREERKEERNSIC